MTILTNLADLKNFGNILAMKWFNKNIFTST